MPSRRPELTSPTRSIAAVAAAAALAILACGCGAPTPVDLGVVDPPPDLEQLDLAVREQFDSIWQQLSAARDRATGGPELAAAWGALGQWFDVYGYGDRAGECYRNAAALDPDEPRWPYYLGLLAVENGDIDGAAEYLETSAALAPDEVAPRTRMADLALQRLDLDAAEAIYREVLDEHPASPCALLGLGRLALARSEPDAALEPLQRLVELQPEAFEVRYALGLAWRQLGDLERAEDHLDRIPSVALEQIPLMCDDPWFVELNRVDRGARMLTRRGVRAARRGEHVNAAALLGRAVIAEPEGPEKRINYALALRELGYVQSAERQLEAALDLADEGSELNAKAHLELGRLQMASGRREEAARHLETALAGDPRSIPAHVELGRLRHVEGRLDEALRHYAAARDLDPGQPSVRFWHAALLIVLDRPSEALIAIDEDLQALGDDRQLRLLQARILSAAPATGLRDADRASRLLERSTTPDPDVLFAETAAMVAAEQGRFAEAARWQRSAVEALAAARPRSAAHIARRRLALYERQLPCRKAWEGGETSIRIPVHDP